MDCPDLPAFVRALARAAGPPALTHPVVSLIASMAEPVLPAFALCAGKGGRRSDHRGQPCAARAGSWAVSRFFGDFFEVAVGARTT